MLRLCLLHLAAMVLLVGASGCGEGAPGEESATPTPHDERDRPIRVIDIDLDSCDAGPTGDPRLRIIAHEPPAREQVASVEAAIVRSINYAGEAYGWAPVEPICVHLFASDNGFLQGLQQLAGRTPRKSRESGKGLGSAGYDEATGRDAIYMNLVKLPSDNWAAYLAAHEYYHIVQRHVGDTAGGSQKFPTWFLEGMADWEATKQEGHPRPWWFNTLLMEERAGRGLPFSQLVTRDQWRDTEWLSPRYYKARAALMYLEELAGPTAAYEILSTNAAGDLSTFETAFQEVSGLTLAEFEAGVLPSVERLAARGVGIP
jgi:hypothetical protein